jgi:hypothetical protein
LVALYARPEIQRYAPRWKPSKTRIVQALGGIRQTHEPSSVTLYRWRDELTASVRQRPDRSGDAEFLITVDRVLNDPQHTLTLFRELPVESIARNAMRRDVFLLLAKQRSYEEAAALMDAPTALAALEEHRELPLLARGIIRMIVPFSAGKIIRSQQLHVSSQRCIYFEVFAGTGNEAIARRLAERIIGLDKTERAPTLLRNAATKALRDQAPAFLQSLNLKALAAFPPPAK